MDLIDQSQKKIYEKCKYKVKVWEHNFKKNNGRLPSKLDIKEAELEVRNAYRTYFQLKTAALEQSFMDVDGFNSDQEQIYIEPEMHNATNIFETVAKKNINTAVNPTTDNIWGSHLNKTPSERKYVEPSKPSPNPNLKITRKLSMGSKLIKRNPRKSLSQVKSESSINVSSLSQVQIESDMHSSQSFKGPKSAFSKSSSFSQLVEPGHFTSINSSQPQIELEPSLCFNMKDTKIITDNRLMSSQPINIFQKVLDKNVSGEINLKNVDIEWLERVESSTKVNNKLKVTKGDFISDEDIIDNSDDESLRNTFHIAKKIKFNNTVSSCIEFSASQQNCKSTSNFTRFNSPRETSEQLQLKNDSNRDLERKLEIPINYPEQDYRLDGENDLNKEKRRCEGINTEVNQEMNVATNQSQILFSKSQFSKKQSEIIVKARFEERNNESIAKFTGKNRNENFVQINLKKKIYARGKKTQTFSKYKKKMWRNKKKFLAQEGEEVQKTEKFKSDKLLPLESFAFIDDTDSLMTLDEASEKDIPSHVLTKVHTKYKVESDSDDDNMTLAQIKKSISVKTRANMGEVQDITEAECPKEVSKHSEIVETEKISTHRKPKKNRIQKSKKHDHEISTIPDEVIKNTKINSALPKYRKKTVYSKKNRGNNEYTDNFTAETEVSDNPLKENINEHLFDSDDDLSLFLEVGRIEHTLNLKGVYPLYTPNEDGSLIETPQEVQEALRLFGYNSFREGQEEAVMRILSGKSTLVTLSTGSGKSLCYQLPAYLFRKKYRCITLVISPLISLMEDQIKCIPGVLSAACLHGNQSKTQRDCIIKTVVSGEVSILMVSPEAILSSENSSGFGSILAQLPNIAFACLDEAHCLSQWSHNFRPSYLVVCRILQETLGVQTILGLTATATKITTNSLIDQLKIPDGENGVIKDIPVPSNLNLSVSKDINRDQALLELLLSEPFVDFKSIIIYCLRRNECERVASFLRTSLKDNSDNNSMKRKRMSLQAEPYHAGLSGSRRKSIQKAFMCGELRIVIATVAFGMGINKPDLRSVIHYNMPAKFESYVQEIGRAGRDGLPSHCHVFLDKQNTDVFELRRHIYGNSVDRHIIRKLLQKVFVSCTCEENCFKHEVMFSINSTVQALDVPDEIISTLLCYLELHQNKYIKILKPSYGKCKIISYEGCGLLKKAALTCEPLKVALKMFGNKDQENSNLLEFPVLVIARALKHDSGMLKRILKNLEWVNVNGESKRSSLTVEFSDLSYHLLSPGNLPDEDLDEVLDSLYKKVLEQENTSYSQLIQINEALAKVASLTFRNCLTNNEEKSETLKQDIRNYFESEKPLQCVDIPEISEAEKNAILSDIRSIVGRYSDESFTGRSIARIFHGIASPNFPPYVWGRTKYWRSHLPIHFNTIYKIATSELIKIQLK